MDDDYLGFSALVFFTTVIFVWLLSAIVAGFIAMARARSFWAFATITFFFLGPLGPGFALVAPDGEVEELLLESRENGSSQPAKRKIADGRRRFSCPRCGADNDIPETDQSYDCWRCSEHRKVQARIDRPAQTTAD